MYQVRKCQVITDTIHLNSYFFNSVLKNFGFIPVKIYDSCFMHNQEWFISLGIVHV
jgi:hypothetical protein